MTTKSLIPCSLMSVVLGFAIALTPVNAAAKQQNDQGNFGNLISALNNVNVQTGDVNVVAVDLSNVLRGANINALNNALNKNNIELFTGADSDVVDIQDFLNGLDIDVNIQNVLNDLSVTVDDVLVAVNVLTGQVFVLVLP
jgi:hypothetical protein